VLLLHQTREEIEMSNDIWDWIEDQLTKPGHGWSSDSAEMLAVYDLRAKLTPPTRMVSGSELPELPEPEVLGTSYYDEQTRTHKWKHHYTADQMHAYARAALSTLQSGAEGKDGWLPIESAPSDRTHIRGLWVTSKRDGKPDRKHWCSFVGFVDDSGRFVDPDYLEDFGWEAHDYEAWHALPAPPNTALQPGREG
jgi:hypothetical protein